MNKSIFTVAQIDALLSAKGIVIKGTGASTSAITSPTEGAHYLIGSEGAYNIYTYVNGAWVNGGKWLSQAESQDNIVAAQSWAVGGTGTRSGENTNNAKYWAERAIATKEQLVKEVLAALPQAEGASY